METNVNIRAITTLNDMAAKYVLLGKQIDSVDKIMESNVELSIVIQPKQGLKSELTEIHDHVAMINQMEMTPQGARSNLPSAAAGKAMLRALREHLVRERGIIEEILKSAQYYLKELEPAIKNYIREEQ